MVASVVSGHIAVIHVVAVVDECVIVGEVIVDVEEASVVM